MKVIVGDTYANQHNYSVLVGAIVLVDDIVDWMYKPFDSDKTNFVKIHFLQGPFQNEEWYVHYDDLVCFANTNEEAKYLLAKEPYA